MNLEQFQDKLADLLNAAADSDEISTNDIAGTVYMTLQVFTVGQVLGYIDHSEEAEH